MNQRWRGSLRLALRTGAVSTIVLFTMRVPAVAATTERPGQTNDALRLSLPTAFAGESCRAYGVISGHRFAVVCAGPTHSPFSTNTPPYPRLFILQPNNGRWRVRQSTTLTRDNLCIRVSVHPFIGRGVLISAVSRPWGGSTLRYHLRVYRLPRVASSVMSVLSLRYTDGVSLPIPSTKSGPPAFLVCEPLYSGDAPDTPKSSPLHSYLLRIYEFERGGRYRLAKSIRTRGRHPGCDQAYREVARQLRHTYSSRYKLPDRVPEVASFEQEDPLVR
jgi:hypothetical protein